MWSNTDQAFWTDLLFGSSLHSTFQSFPVISILVGSYVWKCWIFQIVQMQAQFNTSALRVQRRGEGLATRLNAFTCNRKGYPWLNAVCRAFSAQLGCKTWRLIPWRTPCNPRCQKMRRVCSLELVQRCTPESHDHPSKNQKITQVRFLFSRKVASLCQFFTFRLSSFSGFRARPLRIHYFSTFGVFAFARAAPKQTSTEHPTHPAGGGVVQTNQHWWSNRKLPLFWWSFCGLVAAVRTELKSVRCAVLCSWRGCQLPGTERKVKAGLDRQPPRFVLLQTRHGGAQIEWWELWV